MQNIDTKISLIINSKPSDLIEVNQKGDIQIIGFWGRVWRLITSLFGDSFHDVHFRIIGPQLELFVKDYARPRSDRAENLEKLKERLIKIIPVKADNEAALSKVIQSVIIEKKIIDLELLITKPQLLFDEHEKLKGLVKELIGSDQVERVFSLMQKVDWASKRSACHQEVLRLFADKGYIKEAITLAVHMPKEWEHDLPAQRAHVSVLLNRSHDVRKYIMQAALQQGNLLDGFAVVALLPRTDQPEAQKAFLQAIDYQLLEKGNFDEVKKIGERYPEIKDQISLALVQELCRRQELDQAHQIVRAMPETNRWKPKSLEKLYLSAVWLGRFELAESLLPLVPSCLRRPLIEALIVRGKYAAAERLIGSKKEDEHFLPIVLGYIEKGFCDEADRLARAMKGNDKAKALLAVAQERIEQNNLAKALLLIEKITAPSLRVKGWKLYAKAMVKAGHYEEALKFAKVHGSEVMEAVVLADVQMGPYERALSLISTLAHHEREPLLVKVIEMMVLQGRINEAFAIVSSLSLLPLPESCDVFFSITRALSDQGYFQQLIEFRGIRNMYLENYISAGIDHLCNQGAYDQLLASLDKISDHGVRQQSLVTAAKIALKKGKLQYALDIIHKMTPEPRQDKLVALHRAYRLLDEGQIDETFAFAGDPANHDIKENIFYALRDFFIRNGEYSQALLCMKEHSSSADPECLQSMVRGCIQKGAYHEAQALARTDAEKTEVAALILASQGEYMRATQEAKQLLRKRKYYLFSILAEQLIGKKAFEQLIRLVDIWKFSPSAGEEMDAGQTLELMNEYIYPVIQALIHHKKFATAFAVLHFFDTSDCEEWFKEIRVKRDAEINRRNLEALNRSMEGRFADDVVDHIGKFFRGEK